MSPLIPLPEPLPQPAPPVLLWALLQLTFLLHVLAMNVVLGGSILALHWRLGRRSADAGHRATMVSLFAKALPVAVAATVTLGVAPLLFVQVLYGRTFLTSSILMGWLWLAVIPLVVLAYFGAYRLAFRPTEAGRAARAVATFVTLLFAAVAFLYVSNVTRSLLPATFAEVYARSGAGLTLNLSDPTFWPRYLHVLCGAVAVAALVVAVFGASRRSRDPGLGGWAMRRGTVTFAVATAANLFVGTWLLVSQPKAILILLVGADSRAMTVLAAGILLAVAAAGAAPLALGARHAARAIRVLAGLVLLTLVAMLLLRDQLRQLALRSAGLEHSSWIRPQWGPMALFAVLLVVATAAVGWMVVVLTRGSSPSARGGAAALLLLAVGVGAVARAAEPSDDARVEPALAEARAAAGELGGQIKALLVQEVGSGGYDAAVRVCAETAPAKTAAYRETSGHEIRRVSLRYRNAKNAPDTWQTVVLESFDRLPAGQRSEAERWEVVSESSRDSLRYMKPLVANAMCLTCHGELARIPPAVRAAIATAYPEDRATGYAVGDVRGAISVRIPLPSTP